EPPAADERPPTAAQQAHERGERLVHKWVTIAWAAGLALGFLVYLNGYAVARRIVRVPPVGWIYAWLYHRMYFDELYFGVFVAITVGLSRSIAFFDRYVVDGVVNGVAWLARQVSFGVGATDRDVIDGAVNGVGRLVQGVG